MRYRVLAGALALLFCTQTAWGDCTKDTDCKGDRICVQGACVAPSAVPSTTPQTGNATAPPPPTTPPPPPPVTPPPPPPATPPTEPAPAKADAVPEMTHLDADVPTAAFPGRALPVTVAADLGVSCALGIPGNQAVLGAPSEGGCGFLIHLVPVDFKIGDIHANIVPAGRITGGGAGLELGSTYLQLGGAASPVAMVIRVDADFEVTTIGGGPQSTFLAGTFGPRIGFMFALAPMFMLDASIAGGLMAGAFPSTSGVDAQPSYGGAAGYFQLAAGGRL